MSIKVSTEVWRRSRHKSGNLLVLLALADHADDQGRAWPGIPLLAREARLSERHTRRCVEELIASGEVEILQQAAPSGGKWYQIQLHRLAPDSLSARSSASGDVTPMSRNMDLDDHAANTPYIEEPSIESSEEPMAKIRRNNSNPHNQSRKKPLGAVHSLGLTSQPKNGF